MSIILDFATSNKCEDEPMMGKSILFDGKHDSSHSSNLSNLVFQLKGINYAALSACATAFARHGTASDATLEAQVDGVPLQSLKNYRAVSPAPPFHFTEVAGNPFGLCPAIRPCPLTSQAAADGFWIILDPPLSAGKHEIDFKATVPFPELGFTFTSGANYCLIVQPSSQTCP